MRREGKKKGPCGPFRKNYFFLEAFFLVAFLAAFLVAFLVAFFAAFLAMISSQEMLVNIIDLSYLKLKHNFDLTQIKNTNFIQT